MLWDDGPIIGKLTGDRRITDAIWSDAAGCEFLAPASGGDGKSGERTIAYELRFRPRQRRTNFQQFGVLRRSSGKSNPDQPRVPDSPSRSMAETSTMTPTRSSCTDRAGRV